MTVRFDMADLPKEIMHGPEDRLLEMPRGSSVYIFACQSCGKQWDAGFGRRVGFVKASAMNHANVCGFVHRLAKHLDVTPDEARRAYRNARRREIAETRRAQLERARAHRRRWDARNRP